MTSMRHLLSFSAFALALAVPAVAAAQQEPQAPPADNPNCPPGSWFCADTQTQPAAPANQPVQQAPLQPLPGEGQTAPRPPVVQYQPAPPPPVVVYQPPPPVMVVRPEAP